MPTSDKSVLDKLESIETKFKTATWILSSILALKVLLLVTVIAFYFTLPTILSGIKVDASCNKFKGALRSYSPKCTITFDKISSTKD